ncbi:MAG TPA: MFS transporter [Anaerolineae bacterium]|mgnify:FL=1|nr:MFS transporter [Anaerolineae bacterium]HOS79675.1 MFS transporter [Anaerolineae bacterium]HQE98665.1 MFS transporter [Anaerolineae bacterium]HQJ11187.1 MFS transporter [Anaerolineae bacterium]HQM15148.1 MFS transporter [Anaerolineae bacterium]
MPVLRDYLANVRRFSPDARRYLWVSALQGMGQGVFQLLFNFYILSLGHQEGFLGFLISLPSFTALIFVLYAGYISDRIGRRATFLLGGVVSGLAQLLMLLSPTPAMLILASILRGIGASLFGATTAPFLMENSTPAERTHLFSFNAGISTMSSFVGNIASGALPAFFAWLFRVNAQSTKAYGWSLAITTLLTLATLLPMLGLRRDKPLTQRQIISPFAALKEQRGSMTRLLLPSLIISMGAGLLIPFLNIFFRNRYGLSDSAIGTLYAVSSLGMGVAILLAPILAERWGKAMTVVATQGLSIPFLILMGFVPNLPLAILSFFMRMALMNLSGPVYQTMVMEEADESSRTTAASLYNMIWSMGRAISPSLSGPIQQAYGFDPVFGLTIFSYAISIYMVYRWFVWKRPQPSRLEAESRLP